LHQTAAVGSAFTLGKQERVKSRKLTEQLFSQGKKFMTPPFRIHYLLVDPSSFILPSSLQFGAGVSTRNFKRAADRNRIKRLSREAWRLQKNELALLLKDCNQQLAVFFIYTGKELPSFEVVKAKTAVALNKLMLAIRENNPAGT
jgi:ribonuclease P protein component